MAYGDAEIHQRDLDDLRYDLERQIDSLRTIINHLELRLNNQREEIQALWEEKRQK